MHIVCMYLSMKLLNNLLYKCFIKLRGIVGVTDTFYTRLRRITIVSAEYICTPTYVLSVYIKKFF